MNDENCDMKLPVYVKRKLTPKAIGKAGRLSVCVILLLLSDSSLAKTANQRSLNATPSTPQATALPQAAPIIAQKTSRAYLQKFSCPVDKQSGDCFLFFQPFDIGGMTIQAVCNDCFLEWQQQRHWVNEIYLNNRLALIRTDLQPYRDTGKNWYTVKWLTLIE